MREIKFRGRDGRGVWHYGYLANIRLQSVPLWDSPTVIRFAEIVDEDDLTNRVDPNTVGQFIGLKDLTGKEIYEGDIVKCGSGRICKVVFFMSACACCFDLVPVGGFDCKPPKESTLWKDLTVIGNVYDNPDLLEAYV